jgi:hypothetical protein
LTGKHEGMKTGRRQENLDKRNMKDMRGRGLGSLP